VGDSPAFEEKWLIYDANGNITQPSSPECSKPKMVKAGALSVMRAFLHRRLFPSVTKTPMAKCRTTFAKQVSFGCVVANDGQNTNALQMRLIGC
jgi:hypothetical protein